MASESPSLASIIASLIAAFGSGREVLRRLIAKHQNKKLRRKDVRQSDEHQRALDESLSRCPRIIRDTYDGHATKYGHRYRAGDDISNTSLAHTLMQLNTGLANIIEAFLFRSVKDFDPAHRSLLNLSETATSQSLLALNGLQDRLEKPLLTPPNIPSSGKRRTSQPKASAAPASKSTKPAPTKPHFVRSKSDSAILIETPPKSNAGRPHRTKKRKHSSSSSRTTGDLPPIEAEPVSTASTPNVLTTRPSDRITGLVSMRQEPVRKQRPISSLTFMTDSTKIGEIPEHRWQAARHGQGHSGQGNAVDDSALWWPPVHHPDERKRGIGSKLMFWRKA